ncbi:rhamnogalacturonan acetylesterase [Opitutus terrae]|uniref:Lipolytic protein G-D-S-L family n=1 Tax=Opitutus terrae (strain DSM 11246 / JCM 15787 / PB90-1) TaxID=452637 RepID=B1ZRD4_OPITP|nr:rhamnogalacturonan acetylesterase [Opitutus terrae]ACB74621.1 lipolytic protein G-D-S-L family [Opitutus terrae PB90-1]
MKPSLFPFCVAVCATLALSPASPAADSLRRQFDLAQFTAADVFTPERGYGFDLGTAPDPSANPPFYFSVAVPEGNYRVTVTFGDPQAPSSNTLKAESRQLLLEHLATRPGELVTRSFIVNLRTPRLPPPEKNAPGGSAVLLNERERDLLRWDDKLTLECNGPAPRVRTIVIEPATVPTVFLAGDSTVTDQPHEPAASWGQMLPRFFKPSVAVANHAESGETLKSFLSGLRLAKILSQIQPGDYLFLQFGHNDQKQQWPQTYVVAATTYRAYLRAFIAEARLRGATPVLVTSMQRRNFDAAGRIKNTLGDYPAAVRAVAQEENVALVDLERMSIAFYEALGPTQAPLAFSNGGKDPTHHNNYGAYELAKCVAQAIRDAHLPLAEQLADDFSGFDPSHPDAPESFALPASPARSTAPLRGN